MLAIQNKDSNHSDNLSWKNLWLYKNSDLEQIKSLFAEEFSDEEYEYNYADYNGDTDSSNDDLYERKWTNSIR